jgi:hypothetical protein
MVYIVMRRGGDDGSSSIEVVFATNADAQAYIKAQDCAGYYHVSPWPVSVFVDGKVKSVGAKVGSIGT